MTTVVRRRIVDRKIVEAFIAGKGRKAIKKELHVGSDRVKRVRELAIEYGYIKEDMGVGSVKLPPFPEAIFPDPVDGRSLIISESHKSLMPYLPWMKERMTAGWHAISVFEELPIKVSRSSFYRFIYRHNIFELGKSTRRVIPEIVHKPGEALILDWGKLRDVIDPKTGKKRTLWLLSGVMGFSRYMMVRLVWSNNVETTLAAIESMFKELGGIPFKITSDNPKCFATEASKYEPILNPALERFANYYGFTMECLPPRDPQKKGKVERSIPYARRLYEAHGNEWYGIEESQEYMSKKLEIANKRKHGTTLRHPLEVFINEEANTLKTLPPVAYEIETFHEGSIRKDGHVRFQNKYYSVEEKYIGKKVVVLGNSEKVSIYFKGTLIEVHSKIKSQHISKSTKPHHLKPWERAMGDKSVYKKRAAKLGKHVEEIIDIILIQGNGFIDTRKIWGILSLDKTYSPEKINEACKTAIEIGSYSYQLIKRILDTMKLKDNKKIDSNKTNQINQIKSYKFVRSMDVYQEELDFIN